MANTFTIRELTKRGFERREDLDFRDDGNAFKCFMYKGFIVTYLKSNNRYYLSININWNDRSFTFDEASTTDWYDLVDEFNGCGKVDIDKFMSNFEAIIKGMKDLEEKVGNSRPDEKELQRYLNKEIELAESEVAYFKANYDWFNKDNWDLKWDIDRVKYLEKAIANAKKVDYSKMSSKQLREIEQRIAKYQTADHNLDGRFIYEICE